MSHALARGLLALLVAAPFGCGEGAQPIPPVVPGPGGEVERIVLVTIDTLRADHVGAYGAEGAATPTFDALAAKGTLFRTAISPAPLTLPSHATILTGMRPPEHGVRHNGIFRLGPEVRTLPERLRDSGFGTAAFVSTYVLDSGFGLDQGFDVYDDTLGVRAVGHGGPTVSERPANETIERALAWLDAAPERFFVWVHLYDPHAGYHPPEPFARTFAGREYDGEIAFADAQVGLLHDAISKRWPDGTVWVVTSDHGEALGEHGETTHSYGVYESTQRVPLVWAGPGIQSGAVREELASLSDLSPTIAALAGLPPGDSVGSGRSLDGLLRGEDDPEPRKAAWVESLATQLDMGWSPLLGVRTASHKFVRAPRPELYDLATDPHEQVNLFAHEPELAAELDSIVAEMASAAGHAPSVDPGAADRARLEALGYVVPDPTAPLARELGVVGGPDPKDAIAIMEVLNRGTALMSLGQPEEALEVFESIEGEVGYSIESLRSGAALQAGQYAKAERYAQKALAMFARTDSMIVIGASLELRGRIDEARDWFERATSIEPEASDAWVGRGRIKELAGQIGRAREIYEHVLTLPIPSAEAIWRLAALDIEAGDRRLARQRLAGLPQAELRQVGPALRLGQAELGAGQHELAQLRIEGALRLRPDDLRLLLARADVHDSAGHLDLALADRERALASSPGNPVAMNVLAWNLARLQRDLPRAGALAESAAEKLGRIPPILDTMAWVALATGDPARCLSLAAEGLETATGPARVDLLLRRAQAQAALGSDGASRRSLVAAGAAAEALPISQRSPTWEPVRSTLDGG